MVLQAPLLQLLHRRFGKPCKLLSFGQWSRPLFASSPDVGEIWQLGLRHAPYALSPQRWALVRELRRHDGPVYVSEDIPGHVRRIRQLLQRGGISPDRSVFLNDCEGGEQLHWVDRLLAFGRLTPRFWSSSEFPSCDDEVPATPCLHVDAAARVDCEEWLAGRGLVAASLVLLQPGNKRTSRRIASRKQHDSKAWPLERWVALVHAIRATSAEFRIVLCGSAHEHALLEEIRARANCSDVTIATRDLPVRRLLALAESAHSMIGVDTGPLHVAAAVGCPLVVLYGSESPARWDRRSPVGRPVINLGGPPRGAVDAIELDEVVAAWRRIALQRDAESGK